MDATTHTHNQTSTPNATMINLITASLFALGLICHLMASPALLYDIVFKGLSLALVLMGIVVNAPKASEQMNVWIKRINAWKRKKRGKKRRAE